MKERNKRLLMDLLFLRLITPKHCEWMISCYPSGNLLSLWLEYKEEGDKTSIISMYFYPGKRLNEMIIELSLENLSELSHKPIDEALTMTKYFLGEINAKSLVKNGKWIYNEEHLGNRYRIKLKTQHLLESLKKCFGVENDEDYEFNAIIGPQ